MLLVLTPEAQFSSDGLLRMVCESGLSCAWPHIDPGVGNVRDTTSSVAVRSPNDCLLLVVDFDDMASLFSRCFCRAPVSELVSSALFILDVGYGITGGTLCNSVAFPETLCLLLFGRTKQYRLSKKVHPSIDVVIS